MSRASNKWIPPPITAWLIRAPKRGSGFAGVDGIMKRSFPRIAESGDAGSVGSAGSKARLNLWEMRGKSSKLSEIRTPWHRATSQRWHNTIPAVREQNTMYCGSCSPTAFAVMICCERSVSYRPNPANMPGRSVLYVTQIVQIIQHHTHHTYHTHHTDHTDHTDHTYHTYSADHQIQTGNHVCARVVSSRSHPTNTRYFLFCLVSL